MQFQYNSDYPDRFYSTTGSTANPQQQRQSFASSTTTTSSNSTTSTTTSTTTSGAVSTTTSTNFSSSSSISSNNLHIVDARDPYHFPPVQPISCARITTRIYNPMTQSITTVTNVLVKTQTVVVGGGDQQQPPQSTRGRRSSQQQQRLSVQSFDLKQFQLATLDDGDANMDDISSCDSEFTDDDDDNDNDEMVDPLLLLSTSNTTADDVETDDEYNNNPNHIAYWIQNVIREAIYGRVYKAIVLRKIHPRRKQQISLQLQQQQPTTTPIAVTNVEWEITNYDCAVKEMYWEHIRKERDHLAEDPVKEVCAMQYLKCWYSNSSSKNQNQNQTNSSTTGNQNTYDTINNGNQQNHVVSAALSTTIEQQQSTTAQNTTIGNLANPISSSFPLSNNNNASGNNGGLITTSFQQMIDTNVMTPLDLLSDEQYLYSIMPFCNGGELFELLNTNDRFNENEARYWMKQVLNGLECLQHAGICHRDMSLENLLVHENGTVLVIDMGMCLRVPFQLSNPQQQGGQQDQSYSNNYSTHTLSSTFNEMRLATATATGFTTTTTAPVVKQEIDPNNVPDVPSVRNLRRYMMKPQGTCGKWHYMSPEIHNNREPFDGYTVDMWAAGVILFLMLTGFPPWDRPSLTDERFKYMSAGYLVQMLTEWEIGLSSDAMDLLQRMMFLDPKDRLSLDQVRAHPWMVNGPCQPPTPNTF